MEYINGAYFLNEEESRFFLQSAVFPDASVMRKRDAYFAKIESSLKITYTDDGGMLVDLPNIQPGWKPVGLLGRVISYRSSFGRAGSFAWNDSSYHERKKGCYKACAAR